MASSRQPSADQTLLQGLADQVMAMQRMLSSRGVRFPSHAFNTADEANNASPDVIRRDPVAWALYSRGWRDCIALLATTPIGNQIPVGPPVTTGPHRQLQAGPTYGQPRAPQPRSTAPLHQLPPRSAAPQVASRTPTPPVRPFHRPTTVQVGKTVRFVGSGKPATAGPPRAKGTVPKKTRTPSAKRKSALRLRAFRQAKKEQTAQPQKPTPFTSQQFRLEKPDHGDAGPSRDVRAEEQPTSDPIHPEVTPVEAAVDPQPTVSAEEETPSLEQELEEMAEMDWTKTDTEPEDFQSCPTSPIDKPL
ncbi:uncharacterized protein LOC126833100 [Adelges cooleyi]|uniref:uncharacterized protein LOC126833100 n=1 Tax=Adelges cooleyi TaxID=133065 RepID=UPI00217FF35A|nr:uncharacterized protein LOC126833100 [Adelges cooleyi]